MAVHVAVIGENDRSDEYLAAESLRRIIETSVSESAMGEIILFPSATLYGQSVKDIDIMMIGLLKNCSAYVRFNVDGTLIEDDVYLESFCTTIEVKAHNVANVRREGTNMQVFYSNSGWHNATKQSNAQKTSAMNFFNSTLGDSPYITNLLWFVEVSKSELFGLMSFDGNTMPSNVLPTTFDFSDIVQKLALQTTPRNRNGRYIIDSRFNGRDTDAILKPLMFFSNTKAGVGKLTRKKIEQITSEGLEDKEPIYDKDVLNIFRGRAGTGKTINLIKVAIHLVDEKGARVQILTYNRALVSDIRRLFTLAELPDFFQEKCVYINTMQSFFFGIINGCIYDMKLSGADFLHNYQEHLKKMIDFMQSDPCARNKIKLLTEDNPKYNWEYVLIDEAQDWNELEKSLIIMLYGKNKVFVADGGQQFVRSVVPCDWTLVADRNSIKLRYCLRQKRNLVRFVNSYTKIMGDSHNAIVPSDSLVGGKVILILNDDEFYNVIREEKKEMLKAGNEAYDLLFITPSSLVQNELGQNSFKLLRQFEQNGLLLWDGTNENNRIDFSMDIEESRVLQYESVRGLEGWTVCCMYFDEYMELKEKAYIPDTEGNALFLESKEEKKKRFMLNWATIPFTRAIDTLIITLKNKDSAVSKQLIKLAEDHSDYIRIT